jgi:hypothetical protein
MESNTIRFIPHSQYIERANSFYEVYELIDVIVKEDPRYSKRNMKLPRKRTCRFCGKSYPETQFSNYSHLLPQFVGNRNLYSDFECDTCNELFSVVENDLAEFLGLSRSILGLAEEKKAARFTARTLFTKSRSFIGHNLLIIAPDDVEISDNRTTIRYIKNSFLPANVYKAL